MNKPHKTRKQPLDELQEITSRMIKAEESLRAILNGEVDGLVVNTAQGDRVFTLSGADHPYRIMVEAMNEGAVTLAADSMILFCNQRFADIVQGSLEKVMGSSIYQYFSSTNLPLFKGLFEQGLKGNSKMELALQTGGEKSAPALLSISALGHTDALGAVCMVVTDLTEQKRNEEILAEGKLTTQILNQAAEIFVLCDPQGRIIRASDSTNKLFDKSPILQVFDKVFHLHYSDGTPFVLLSAISTNDLYTVEVTFKHENKKLFSFLLSASALIADKGTIGIVIVMVDITERKKVEEKIEHLASFPQLSPHPIIETDLKGRIIFCNTATMGILKELNVPDEVHLFLPCDLSKTIKKLKQGNDLQYLSHEVEISGRVFAESIVLSAKMKVVRIYAQNITKRKNMEDALQKAHNELEKRVAERTAQLVESNKSLKQEIVKRIAVGKNLEKSQERLHTLTKHLQNIREHERAFLSRELHDQLGQALTGMKMDIRWIERRLPEAGTLISERLGSIITLIDGAILSVQRISMELRPPALDDFGISEAIKSILTNFEKKTPITYKLISTPQRIVLNGDIATEVFRICQEALTNVIRHADANNVTILLRNTGDKFIMEIRDDGRGITKKELMDHKSIGLTGMRERAYAIEGNLSIIGMRQKGTVVTLSVPLNKWDKKHTKTIKRGPKKAPKEA